MAKSEQQSPPGDQVPRETWMDRAGGPVAFAFKLLGLALVDALAIYAAMVFIGKQTWWALGLVVVVTLAINAVYISKKSIPLKYLVPGLVFLLVYQVFVVLYSFYISFTNYGDGHNDDKAAAISQLLTQGERRVENSPTHPLQVVDEGKPFSFVVTIDGTKYIGDAETPLKPTTKDYTPMTLTELSQHQEEVFSMRVSMPNPDDGWLRTEDGSSAYQAISDYTYDEAADTLTNSKTGEVYTADQSKGAFVNTKGEQLMPGWTVTVGFSNYTKAVTDPRIRGPFFRVFIWTFVFAIFSALAPFAVGLIVAMILNEPTMKGQKIYRSLLIIPYAVPAFLSAMVWQGLLNTDYGFINQVILGGASIPWLTDPNLARVSLILVQMWMGFPYFFIVCTGALTSIPSDIIEAARVDGANAWQVFWKVKFPLLMVAVGPLLIASFAFNFNNYNTIKFLTDGGPTDLSASVTVGYTDILITFVDKLAFSGAQKMYGFASAIAVVIFLIVASISLLGFRRTRMLEELDK